ncbi:MAG: hypothetical protein ACM31D_19335 [Bacteroidota bacterium]
MSQCRSCPRRSACRVPADLDRFHAVAHRLEQEHRAPNLSQRLRYYTDRGDCLVEAGYVDL